MVDAIEVEVDVMARKSSSEFYEPLKISVAVRPEADNLAEAVVAGLREATRIAAERLGQPTPEGYLRVFRSDAELEEFLQARRERRV